MDRGTRSPNQTRRDRPPYVPANTKPRQRVGSLGRHRQLPQRQARKVGCRASAAGPIRSVTRVGMADCEVLHHHFSSAKAEEEITRTRGCGMQGNRAPWCTPRNHASAPCEACASGRACASADARRCARARARAREEGRRTCRTGRRIQGFMPHGVPHGMQHLPHKRGEVAMKA